MLSGVSLHKQIKNTKIHVDQGTDVNLARLYLFIAEAADMKNWQNMLPGFLHIR